MRYSEFEEEFFRYTVPKPKLSVHSSESVHSNDLRLLVEIATGSKLRMFTDSKTGHVHFVCKVKGPNCFSTFAEKNESGNYIFKNDYRLMSHKHNCEAEVNKKFIEIYNLMKIKKDLIEEFMKQNDLLKETPSDILYKISNSSNYFYQKFIEGNLELKRKLRKRFDNIVNIDIKKININHSKQHLETPRNPKSKKNTSKTLSQQRQIFMQKSNIQNASKKIKKLASNNRITRQKHQESPKPLHLDQDEEKENIFGNMSQESQIYHSSSELPEVKELNTPHLQIQFSSSEDIEDPVVEQNYFGDNFQWSDYIQSLRNSSLKRSLETQSLSLNFLNPYTEGTDRAEK